MRVDRAEDKESMEGKEGPFFFKASALLGQRKNHRGTHDFLGKTLTTSWERLYFYGEKANYFRLTSGSAPQSHPQ